MRPHVLLADSTEPMPQLMFQCLFPRQAAMCYYLAVVPIGWRCLLSRPAFGRSAPLPPRPWMRRALQGTTLLSAGAEAHPCALSLFGFETAYAWGKQTLQGESSSHCLFPHAQKMLRI